MSNQKYADTIEIDDCYFFQNRILISYNALIISNKETVEIHGCPNDFHSSNIEIEITDVKLTINKLGFEGELTIPLTDIVTSNKEYLEYFKTIISEKLTYTL